MSSKHGNRNRSNESETTEVATGQPVDGAVEQPMGTLPVATIGPNFTLFYRREHPGNRSSFGIQGVSGIVVFDNGLFAGGQPPATILLDTELVQPKADAKAAKAAEAAARLEERATKAKERLEAQQLKAKERQVKADEQLAKAKAKLEATKVAAGVVGDAAVADPATQA